MRGGNALPSPPAAHPVNTAFVNPRDPPRMGFVSRMLGFWSNFAAGGDPNGAPCPFGRATRRRPLVASAFWLAVAPRRSVATPIRKNIVAPCGTHGERRRPRSPVPLVSNDGGDPGIGRPLGLRPRSGPPKLAKRPRSGRKGFS